MRYDKTDCALMCAAVNGSKVSPNNEYFLILPVFLSLFDMVMAYLATPCVSIVTYIHTLLTYIV